MSAFNSIGNILRLSTFGESHGSAIGGVLEGLPPGFSIDPDHIKQMLLRRATHTSFFSSQRAEPDDVEFIAGLVDNTTTGAPLAFLIHNKDARKSDYDAHKDVFRPSHADYTYFVKYGTSQSGGGRASARETVARVVAGAIAIQILRNEGVTISAFVKSIGDISMPDLTDYYSVEAIESSVVRCPDVVTSDRMLKVLKQAADSGDTLGGVVHADIRGCPPGMGEPVYYKLNAALAFYILSIPSTKAIEFGDGFDMSTKNGSAINDSFVFDGKKVTTLTNHSSGIQGGISNGEAIRLNVAFKPISSIQIEQQSINIEGNAVKLKIGGRHDVCVVPRAIPIVESMIALCLLDFLLINRIYSRGLRNE